MRPNGHSHGSARKTCWIGLVPVEMERPVGLVTNRLGVAGGIKDNSHVATSDNFKGDDTEMGAVRGLTGR